MYDEAQQQIPMPSSNYMNPMESYGSTILMMIDPAEELQKIENFLKSQVVNDKGEVKKYGEPLLNDFGCNSILGIMQGLCTKVTVMSNLDKREIPMLIDMLADTLARDLMVHRVDYEIKESADRDKIFDTVLMFAFVIIKRGYAEGEKRFLKGSMQEIRTTVDNSGNKQGLLGKLNPWNKR